MKFPFNLSEFCDFSVLCGVQGLICSLVSLRTVTICTDMLVDKDEVIAVYLMFMGFFFIYDLVAMFMDFLARCREVGRYEVNHLRP